MDPKKIKKGDNLVYHNRVLKVMKIKKDKKLDDMCVLAKPHFVTRTGLMTLFSIPFKSMAEGNIRKLMSKTSVEKLLRTLQHETVHDGEKINVSDVVFAELTTEDMITMLQLFWDERAQDPSKFATSKKLLMNRLLRSLSHIVGAAYSMSLEKAEGRIEKRLDKRVVKIIPKEE